MSQVRASNKTRLLTTRNVLGDADWSTIVKLRLSSVLKTWILAFDADYKKKRTWKRKFVNELYIMILICGFSQIIEGLLMSKPKASLLMNSIYNNVNTYICYMYCLWFCIKNQLLLINTIEDTFDMTKNMIFRVTFVELILFWLLLFLFHHGSFNDHFTSYWSIQIERLFCGSKWIWQ